MAQQVILPRQGQSVETCLILSWRKKEGDPVREGEVLAEVETDKAAFEVPSTASGTVLKLLHAEGEDVPVLAPLAVVGEPGEDIAALTGPAAAPVAAASVAAASVAAPGEARELPPPVEPVEPAEPVEPVAARPAAGGRIAISPRARRLAETSGLGLAAVLAGLAGRRGSGPRGRILERDVRAVLGAPGAAGPSETPEAPAALGEWVGPVTETPVQGVRKRIAERMHASLQSSAQYTLQAAADAEGLLALRGRLKQSPEELGLRGITLGDLLSYAVSRVLLRHPQMNAHFDGSRLRSFERVHLGVAVDTPRGLMVPVVRDAARLSLRALAAEASRLQQVCRSGTVSPEELAGGTFTVTNLGPMGIEGFTPVLNPPQVAILGVGGLTLRPVQAGQEVVFRRFLGLSLTADHRVVDGAPAARFLRALGQALEQFELLLAE